jgi:hypothetical protein
MACNLYQISVVIIVNLIKIELKYDFKRKTIFEILKLKVEKNLVLNYRLSFNYINKLVLKYT